MSFERTVKVLFLCFQLKPEMKCPFTNAVEFTSFRWQPTEKSPTSSHACQAGVAFQCPLLLQSNHFIQISFAGDRPLMNPAAHPALDAQPRQSLHTYLKQEMEGKNLL